MATEKRLIDANDALERMKKAEKKMRAVSIMGCKAVPMYAVIDFIESRPTVDAVEVVRCKDCGHGSHVDTPEGRVWCDKMCRYMVFEGYCSYGERRSNGKPA